MFRDSTFLRSSLSEALFCATVYVTMWLLCKVKKVKLGYIIVRSKA